MGSSWRYCHVAITPYSIGGFHGLAHMFFTGLLVLFHGLAFLFDGQAREFTHRWKNYRRAPKISNYIPLGMGELQINSCDRKPSIIDLDECTTSP